MSKPKLFVGSSQQNLSVAQQLKIGLQSCADVRLWSDGGVFGLNQSFLESLLESLVDHDFAVLVLAPDDMTTSKGESWASPRDNVLFESGLFMGALGRDRVFLVCDQSIGLKIPSDLAGIKLASYDGARLEQDPVAAMADACRLIGEHVTARRWPHLLGAWHSRYPMPFEDRCPIADEVVEIAPRRDGIAIVSEKNAMNDHYSAFGRLPQERRIVGEWKSRAESSDTSGVFVLTVHPSAQFMYGYWTSPDMNDGVAYAWWVLAKKHGATDVEIAGRLQRAQDMLSRTTIAFPPPESRGRPG